MRLGISKSIIILGVVMICIDSSFRSNFISQGLINPQLVMVFGFSVYFLEKAKQRTLVYIDKIKDCPVDQLINKRIKF